MFWNVLSTPVQDPRTTRSVRRPTPRRWPGLAIWATLAIALVLRLAWIALVPNAQYSDSVWYTGAAWNLVSSGVYGPDGPSAWFPPGYPFFLAAIYAVAGHNELAGKLGNVALGLILTGTTYLLARLFLSEATALLASAFIAVWPNLIFSTGTLESDLLAACGFVGVLWLGMRPTRHPRWTLLGVGVVCGWMILVRPVSVILLAALGLFWLLQRRSPRQVIAPLAAVTLVAAIVVGAWTVRNYVQFGQVIAIATNGGYNFWQTNQRFADGNDTYWSVVPMDDPEYQTMRDADEFTKNRQGYRYAFAFLRAHPLHPLQMLPTKLFWLYHTDTSGLYEGLLQAPMVGPSRFVDWILGHAANVESATFRYYEALMALAVVGAGIGLVRGPRQWVWPLLSVPLLLTLFHVFFHAKDRFHIPLDGLFAIFAALALTTALSTARARLRRGA